MRQFVTSKDGTRIAYETAGDGRAALIVLGALNSRQSGTKLTKLLASKFKAVSYDRRGRGDSADSASYAPEREVEDIAALIEAVGGPICLYGHSSGAALAMAAAVKLRKQVTRLAMYEAPYALDGTARKAAQEYHVALKQALSAGHNGDAVALFVRSVGVSDQQIQAMRHMPMWKGLQKLAQRWCMTAKSWARGTLCRQPSSRGSGRQPWSCTAVPDLLRCAMQLGRSATPFLKRNFALSPARLMV